MGTAGTGRGCLRGLPGGDLNSVVLRSRGLAVCVQTSHMLKDTRLTFPGV